MWPHLFAEDLKFVQKVMVGYFLECLGSVPGFAQSPLALPWYTRDRYTQEDTAARFYKTDPPAECGGQLTHRNARLWQLGHPEDRKRIKQHLKTCGSCDGFFRRYGLAKDSRG